MKRVCIFFAVATVAIALSLTGCSKEDPAKPLEVDLNRTARVEGNILYNTDITISPQKWSAPSSLTIIASVPYSDLNAGAKGTYYIPSTKITYNSGKYSIEATVGLSGATVTIKVCSFTGEQRQASGNVSGIWSLANEISQPVLPGQTAIVSYKQLTFTADKKSGDDL